MIFLLQSLRSAGFDIVLVSSSPHLDPGDVERARAICRDILHRTNIGLDFGSWRDALAQLGSLDGYQELLLTNDSVYGPLQPFESVFAKMQQRECDFWGTTDCYMMGRHLQSYFLLLRRSVLDSPVFQGFWKDFVFFRNKDNVIRDYEIGLTARLQQAGFRYEVLCPAADLAATEAEDSDARHLIDPRVRGLAYDSSPPIAFWQALVLRHGFPFVKRELVRDNPYRLRSVARLADVVAQVGTYDVSLIQAHLKRLGHDVVFGLEPRS